MLIDNDAIGTTQFLLENAMVLPSTDDGNKLKCRPKSKSNQEIGIVGLRRRSTRDVNQHNHGDDLRIQYGDRKYRRKHGGCHCIGSNDSIKSRYRNGGEDQRRAVEERQLKAKRARFDLHKKDRQSEALRVCDRGKRKR